MPAAGLADMKAVAVTFWNYNVAREERISQTQSGS